MSDTDNPILGPAQLLYGSDESLEPEQEPTDKTEIAEEEAEIIDEVEADDESEEVEQEEAEESDEELIFEFDGREIEASKIKEWEQGYLRQSDYTKKTQKLAQERRDFEAIKESSIEELVSKKHEKLEKSITELELLIKEADESINWDELREYDSSEYIRQKELKEKRVKALEHAQRNKKDDELQKVNDPEFIKREQQILIENNPQWLDSEGNQTEAHKNELETLSKYLVVRGIDKKKQDKITRADEWQVLLDASKFWQSQQKAKDVKKQVKKITPTIKSKRNTTPSKPKTLGQAFYGN